MGDTPPAAATGLAGAAEGLEGSPGDGKGALRAAAEDITAFGDTAGFAAPAAGAFAAAPAPGVFTDAPPALNFTAVAVEAAFTGVGIIF